MNTLFCILYRAHLTIFEEHVKLLDGLLRVHFWALPENEL